jgi:nucleoside-diphosphate-sugar epimerase
MRVFVTGASGWIGSAVVPELLSAGHSVLGLARSDASAEALAAAGADVHRGSLADPDSLRAGAAQADGVIHLAYIHDFSAMAESAAADARAIEALGSELAGSGRPLAIASGTLFITPDRVATERDIPDGASHPRVANSQAALVLADRGVHPIVVRLPPTVHGDGDHGFMAVIVAAARQHGVSPYIGDGSARWPAVHRADAASVFRLALEGAPAGSILHAVAEEGVPIRDIAAAIGRGLDVPVESIAPDAARAHFDWLAAFLGVDSPASSALTREQLGWAPTGPGLIADLEAGHYFTELNVEA